MSLMGIDIGTTGVKATVFDENGVILARTYEEYPLLFPFPGACELDSNAVIDATMRVIRDAARQAAEPISVIGIASQGEAFTPISRDGKVLGNIMVSSDARASSLVEPWSQNFGVERLYQITGHTPYSMYSLYKMLWLKEHQPENWNNTWKFLFCQDLIAWHLTGEAKTDMTMAARSMLFDIRKKKWSTEILDALGLSVNRLPEVVRSGEPVGAVKTSIATSLGLSTPTLVSVCGHDQPVGALGCGAASPGLAAYSIGTTECVCPSIERAILNSDLMKANLATYPHVFGDAYTTVAFSITGGSVLRWVRDNIAIHEVEEALRTAKDPYDRIIESASPDPSKVVLLPHFGPTGTPHFDAHGVGVIFGLTLSTSRAEVLRAFLDGITYEMKWNLEILKQAGFQLTNLRAVGGGAKNEKWMQIKADILGIPLTTMKVTEATCMGAALLAAHGAGIMNLEKSINSWAVPIRTFQPKEEFHSFYDQRFRLYKEIYEALDKARKINANLDSLTQT